MIFVKDFTSMAFSYGDGMQLREKILEALKEGSSVVVDFDGIYVFTPMFFNACSGHFVLFNGVDWYNNMITFKNLNDIGASLHRLSVKNAQTQREEEDYDFWRFNKTL